MVNLDSSNRSYVIQTEMITKSKSFSYIISYTVEDFELFQVFFKQNNQSNQTLKYFNNLQRFLVNDHNFEGKQAIWNIFAKVKDQLLLE